MQQDSFCLCRRQIAGTLMVIGIAGCTAHDGRHAAVATKAVAATNATGAPKAVKLPEPRVQESDSEYSVTGRGSCPGHRIVNTRYEAASDLVVRITENNLDIECVEGAIGIVTAAVWRGDTAGRMLTSIHSRANNTAVFSFGDNPDRDVPLLETEFNGCCGSPATYEFWNLRTGQRVFTTETEIARFIANGAARYIAAQVGEADTVAWLEYGSGSGAPQRLAFTHTPNAEGDPIVVQSVTIDGPHRGPYGIVIGGDFTPGKDTLPITGAVVHVFVGDLSGTGGTSLNFAARVVNDRLVKVPFE
jgi:hypothetical protein